MTVTTSVPEAPRHDTRELRALALWRARGAEVVEVTPDVYRVPSFTGVGSYRVDYVTETCSCPDSQRRPDLNCKHVLCVGIVRAKERRIPLPSEAHELIRRDAAAHPERTYSEHVEAAKRIAGRQYREDLARISPAAWAELDRQLEAEDLDL